MRNNIIAAVVLAAAILIESMTGAEEMLRLSSRSVFKTMTRGDVIFPHDRHYSSGIECLRCHHRYEKGVNIITIDELQPGTGSVSCAACHSSGRDLEQAYHRMCITCHHDMRKISKRSGPVMCGLCHVKKGEIIMLVAGVKPYDEIVSFLKGRHSVLVVGCGGCTALCHAGGLRETKAMAAKLRRDLGGKISFITIERQCDDESVHDIISVMSGVDAVLSLGCGAGVQLIAEHYPELPVYPGLNTKFVGTSHDRSVFIERCRSCGNCRLGSTGGVCPVTRCAKGLHNGPCGGSENGMCETGNDRECAWCIIISRMKAQGRLEELYVFSEPVLWSGQAPERYECGIKLK